jgi:heme o synthase
VNRPANSFPIHIFIRLSKPIITLSVAFSALTGFILFHGSFSAAWIWLYLGVLLIAGGSSVINQIQEADQDLLMQRTRNRPIPSGQINKHQSWAWAIFLAVSGAIILWYFTNPIAFTLAIITLLWYNGIYTPLKRITPWAILPGAVVGAFPPIIGWSAAGGYILHPHIIFVSFFFFIGQIPHFWLILLRHGQDYINAGFPSVFKIFTPRQISRLTFSWTTSTALIAMLLPAFDIIQSSLIGAVIYIFSGALIICFYIWVKNPIYVHRAFMIMNIYFLMMMILIIIDGISR